MLSGVNGALAHRGAAQRAAILLREDSQQPLLPAVAQGTPDLRPQDLSASGLTCANQFYGPSGLPIHEEIGMRIFKSPTRAGLLFKSPSNRAHHPDFDRSQTQGWKAMHREADLPKSRWNAELERGLKLGLPGADSTKVRPMDRSPRV